MTIVWSLPVRGEPLTSTRGDVVRARHLLEALREEGHEVVVVEDAAHGHTQAAVAAYRVCLRSWLSNRAALMLRDAGRCVHGVLHGLHVAAVVRSTGAGLIVETQVAYTVSGAIASRLTRTPLVLDDCSPAVEEAEFGTGLWWLARAALSAQARCARAVVAVSPVLARMLVAEGVPREKIVCIPNGVSARAFTSPSIAPRRSRVAIDGACVVGFAGSFQPWHRVELLIEALAHVPPGCRVHVVLAGSGPGLDAVLAAAAKHGVQDRLTVLGAVPPVEMPDVLSSWDIGVMPHSNSYGDPMKLREYAAAGLPAIAPNLDPIREVIDDGVTGLLFSPGDSRALAHALARLSADAALRRRLGDEARRRARAAGTWMERARTLVASVHCRTAASSCRLTPHAQSRAETRDVRSEA